MKKCLMKGSSFYIKFKNQLIMLVFAIFLILTTIIISYLFLNKLVSLDLLNLISQWLLVVIGASITLMLFEFQKKLDKDKEDTKGSNLSLLKKIDELNERVNIIDNGKKNLEDIISEEEIFRFIAISMSPTTKDIAEYFNVEISDIKDQLLNLAVVDKKIGTFINYDPRNPVEDTVWFRKDK